ncbi:hypothetical protein FHW67_003396 [Herbaspirillum sp. Sphag1AN]|uniref:hypothetical protein n=1 Tax=unclassified Herbaspirillum TaxID=2624150 RepID=UPI001620CB1E|nr:MULTISPECIES: hypothetical protein [unclassified Herbaspirillum]MBB3214086.1 hypothetical protein [Herbaspirillum sp. Sphag1AN]MBB3247521.1 hypothetical protein [Herbaspirillum sp. Sphag64]
MEPRNRAEILVRDFLYSELTKSVQSADPTGYNSTIAIGSKFLGVGVLDPHKIDDQLSHVGGLIYPSVQGKISSNVTTYNYAIQPRLFDKWFEIIEAKVYCLTFETTQFRLNELNRSTAIGMDGEISWLLSFEEMKGRTSIGLCLDGNNPHLIDLEKTCLNEWH